MTGVFKKMKVAAAQRVTMSLRARQFSDIFWAEGAGSGMSWCPRVTPAPVRGPSEHVYP